MTDTDRLAALLEREFAAMHWPNVNTSTSDFIADRLLAAGVHLTGDERHRLLMPPHPGEVYQSSALCSCGGWQYDEDSFGALTNEYRAVLREHTVHLGDERWRNRDGKTITVLTGDERLRREVASFLRIWDGNIAIDRDSALGEDIAALRAAVTDPKP